MEVKDFFINILIAILIILIVYYLFTTLGWMKNIANDCYSSVPMTGTDNMKSYDEEKMIKCQKDAEEQQKLIDTLKFTPRTYRISLWGYGGEKVMGRVDSETWDYCMENQVDLSDIA